MSSRIRMWKISDDDVPTPIETDFGQVNLEDRLESWIEKTPEILGEELIILGRQFGLPTGESIDLLAIDSDGKIVIIELKRQKSTREAIAQALDYEAIISRMSEEKLNDFVSSYFESRGHKWESLREAFEGKFGTKDVTINNARRTLIVAPTLDLSTERIIDYLSSQYSMEINGITFTYYRDEIGKEFVIRNIMLSKEEMQQREPKKYSLMYHLERAKDFFRPTFEGMLDYFKDKGFELHSTMYYISILKKEIYFGIIEPRKTLAHLTIWSDYYKREDLQRLESLSGTREDFQIGYSDEWAMKEGGRIIEKIRIVGINDFKAIERYDEEIRKAIDSIDRYYENEKELLSQRIEKEAS